MLLLPTNISEMARLSSQPATSQDTTVLVSTQSSVSGTELPHCAVSVSAYTVCLTQAPI